MLRWLPLKLIVALFILFRFASLTLAVPANPFLIKMKQPDGSVFDARIVGDEWNNHIETEGGFTIDKADDGSWRYVKNYEGTTPILSNTPADRNSPNALKQHIRGEFLQSKNSRHFFDNRKSSEELSGTESVGEVNGKILIILAEFNDQAGTYDEASWGDYASIKIPDYFSQASYGKATLTPASESSGVANNGVIGWVNLGYDHPNTANSSGLLNFLITRDAIIAADPFIDYSAYDENSDGILDADELAIVIVVAGYEYSYGGANYTPSVWAHKANLGSGVATPVLDGVEVGGGNSGKGGYAQVGEIHESFFWQAHQGTMGPIVHELGHLIFQLPDLYDVDRSSSGIAIWGVMGSGAWGVAMGESGAGATPVLPCAWTKLKLGWVDAIEGIGLESITASGSPSANPTNSVRKISSIHSSEYFLAENRFPVGYDLGLYGRMGSGFIGGLAIWHIDDSVLTNTNDEHRKVDLEEANGQEMGTSHGHQINLWYEGNTTTFDELSIPNSQLYDGSSSGKSVTDISGLGEVMTAVFNDINPGYLSVTPATDFSSSGIVGTVFSPNSQSYTLSNNGGKSIDFSVSKNAAWFDVNPTSGTLSPGGSTVVVLSLNSNVTGLNPFTYTDTVEFINDTNGIGNTARSAELIVNPTPGNMSVDSSDDLIVFGPEGGPFSIASKKYVLSNSGGSPVDYSVTVTEPWMNVINGSGVLAPGGYANVTVAINLTIHNLNVGTYSDIATFSNLSNGDGNTARNISLKVNKPNLFFKNPQLLRDIFPGTMTVYPYVIGMLHDNMYFFANDGIHGTELWKTDGSGEGTVLVKDINLNPNGGSLNYNCGFFAEALNGYLFFFAQDGIHGTELWKTDGTEQGTVMVKDATPGNNNCYSTYIVPMIEMNGAIYYFYKDDVHGRTLWKSDGSEEGTHIVKDISPGPSGIVEDLIKLNGTLYFQADDYVHGREIWKSDGTEEGTYMLKDIFPGISSSYPWGWGKINGKLLFKASVPGYGVELMETDGTEEGTKILKDINPNQVIGTTSNSNPHSFKNVNGIVYFSADDGVNGAELWKTDGTESGTIMVKDINPAGDSNPAPIININGTIFFFAADESFKRKLWKTDGTADGTKLVRDVFEKNLSYPFIHRGKLYFRGEDSVYGEELWVSDGTESGTVPVFDFYPGPTESEITVLPYKLNGKMVFIAEEPGHGREIWVLDLPRRIKNDFDDDEDTDLLMVHNNGYIANGFLNGSFLENIEFLFQADPAQDWTVNATGDFNGDRKADLLLYSTATGEYRTVLLDGKSVLSDTVLFSIDPAIGFEPRGVGDFDDDGEVEIILYHPPSGFTALVYLTDGAFSSFEAVTTIDVANAWALKGTGFFNHDTKLDFLITNKVTGETSVIEMDGSVPTGPTPVFTLDPATGWKIIGMGDFTGTGNSDVLILHTSGVLGVLVMDGLSFKSIYVPGGLLPNWELVNVGSYNIDGKDDFLFYDTSTGDLIAGIQDGTTITSYTPVLNLGVGSGWSYHSGKP